MKFNSYFDIELLQTNGIVPAVLAGAVIQVLHGCFVELKKKFAIAIPGSEIFHFNKIRVFGYSRNELDTLVKELEKISTMNNYCRICYPREIQEGYGGPWISYCRFRIPSRKSERNPGSQLRNRRIETASKLPYVILSSQSTKQRFSLHFEVKRINQGIENQMSGEPDTYGLARKNNLFFLPDLP